MNDREYYDRLASAYLRGRAERMSQEGPEIRAEGEKQEEKLYYFKRSPEKLPRVRMALGFLRSVWPESLLDVGSGRGAFLFPFLEEFPGTKVTAIDLLPRRVELLQDLSRGGIWSWRKNATGPIRPFLFPRRESFCSRAGGIISPEGTESGITR